MLHTARFSHLRKQTLNQIFDRKHIIEVWRKIVRDQLRSLDIKDLYDHYDFNFNIEDRAASIRSEVLSGGYKVSVPLIYRLEKRFGVCRHIVVPQPSDALILQVLVESVADNVLRAQPSQNSFYSRDKHRMPKPHEVAEYGLSFRQQWKRLQKTIYKFNEDKNLIVVTDLANYYDSIHLDELRKVFAGHSDADEVVIDLLFYIIESISWRPDYLPDSKRGLPTSNLEAIRLLAHSFLFEVDEVVKERTNGSFARWMDDLTIGVNDRTEAIQVISGVSDMLKSRGLALNLSKTDIFNSDSARYHFQVDQNVYLDSIEDVKKGEADYRNVTQDLFARFKEHFEDPYPRNWDKVAKRYITAFGRLGSTRLLSRLSEVYLKYPGLRQNLLYYLASLGYRTRTAKVVGQILDAIEVFDDVSLYQLCHLVSQWEILAGDVDARDFLTAVHERILSISRQTKGAAAFYSVLWFKTKYDHPEDLLNYILATKNYWQTDSFLRRQVTAAMSRVLLHDRTTVMRLLSNQISSGVQGTVSIANQIEVFSERTTLDRKLSFYLFPQNGQRPYPLPKFVVLCSVLNGPSIRGDKTIKEKVLQHVSDPYYRKWLDLQYNIS